MAESIINQWGQGVPADRLLRQALRTEKEMLPRHKAAVVERVYTFFRWKGCLNQSRPLNQQIRMARELDADFRSHAGKIPSEVLKQTIPDWSFNCLKVTREWLVQIQRPALVWLRSPRGGMHRLERFFRKDIQVVGEGPWRKAFRYFGRHDLFQTPLFEQGAYEIQDLASQCVGHFCQPTSGESWWDMCAGEGGKTLHLADLLEGKGCVWATDKSAWRLQRLKRRAARAGMFNYQSAQWETGKPLPFKRKFDGILIDAPCSGLGTWQRHPDARWTTQLDDVRDLAERQWECLNAAVGALKPGGKLVYAVCTLTRQETQSVVKRFERAHPDFIPWPWKGKEPHLPDCHGEASSKDRHGLTLLPHQWKANGMFMVRWRKSKD